MTELELPKQYDPKEAQNRFYEFWVEKGYFHADPASEKPPYTIVIPPPNVTGALHLGHALNNTIQDILIRWRRMHGIILVTAILRPVKSLLQEMLFSRLRR